MNTNLISALSKALRGIASFACFLLFASMSASAQRTYIEAILPSDVRSDAAAASTSAGGNVGSYPDASGTLPHDSANSVFLAESSIGYLGPTLIAGDNQLQQLTTAASSALTAGTYYKSVGIPGNWNISFPGVIDTATGNQTSTPTNFDPQSVGAAVDYYRILALIFPNNLHLRINFLNTLSELIVPYSYAGNNAFARATKERIINGPNDPVPPGPGQPDQANPTAITREGLVLQNALAFYTTAIRLSSDAFGFNDSLQAGFPATLPPGTTEADALVQQLRQAQAALCTAYARALGYKGETLLRYYTLQYFQSYFAPTATNPNPLGAYITALDSHTTDFQMHLLLSSILESNSWFPTAVFVSARAFVPMLSELRRSMQEGSVAFIGLDSSLNIEAHSYPAQYVPFFFDPILFPGNPTTMSGLLAFSRPLITASISDDMTAQTAVTQLETNLQSLAQRLNGINDQYNSQLGQLCGWKQMVTA